MSEESAARLARAFPVTNEVFGAGMGKLWDGREAPAGWQRVPGSIRLVHASIPSPVARLAPRWAGWRAIVSENGKVYDYETGREMTPLGGARP